MKVCSQCNIEKEFSKFYKCKNCVGGFSLICNNCRSLIRNKEKHYCDGKLLCLSCGETKDEEFFSVDPKKSYRNNRSTRCKICKELQRKQRLISNRPNNLQRMLLERFCGLRERAKKSGHLIDFKQDFLLKLWES
jgi:hypothetical protein